MANVSSSNSQKALVPKLRFPGFEGEYILTHIGDIFSERNERGGVMMELLSVTMNNGVVKRSQIEGKDNSSEDKSNYKIVRSGDLVYNSMRMWQGANGISKYDGIVSPAYTVLKAVQEIDEGYFAALFKTVKLINEFRKNSQGLTSDTWNLKYPQISGIRICIPKLSEQHKISSFVRLLDKRIDTQHRLVESLKSYKRGVATAIFEGILHLHQPDGSPYTPWTNAYLGSIFFERVERAAGTEKLLAVTIGHGVQDRADLDLKDNSSSNKQNYRTVRVGDLAYNTMRMWQGACGVSDYEGIVSPAYTVLYARDPQNTYTPFWAYLFKEPSMLHTFQRNSQGLTSDTWNLKYDKFSRITVNIPSVQEQRHIADFLDKLTASIMKQEGALELLSKIKKALLATMFI